MKRALPLLGTGLLLLAAWWAVSEPGVALEYATTPRSQAVVDKGYGAFLDDQSAGRGSPWLTERLFDLNPPDLNGPVVIDRHHTNTQLETRSLPLSEYRYGRMHTYHRAFEPLRAAGVALPRARSALTVQRLGGAAAVFINLPSGDNAGFSHAEVLVLTEFVRRGGGLMLITDHTNAYFSSEMLQPLTQALGLSLPAVTAADRGAGRTMSPGTHAWLRMHATGAHPVVQGVRAFGFMTGGVVTPEAARWSVLATTSEQGWADRWDPDPDDGDPGFSGDFKQQEDERLGPLPVALAGEFGEGRVVVLGDQNAFGETVIGFEDGARLFTNAWSWLLRRPLSVAVRGPDSVTTLAGPRALCGSVEPYAFRTLQVQLQRLAEHHDVPEFCTWAGGTQARRLLLLPEAEHPELEGLLDGAERVVAVLEPEASITAPVLAALGLQAEPGEGAAEALHWLRPMPHPHHPMFDDVPDAEPLAVTPMAVRPVGEESAPEVLAEDSLGRPVVVALSRGGQQWVLVLDADLLRNETLGKERVAPQRNAGSVAAGHRAAFKVLNTLFSPL